ncbi:hypothetical protein COHA_003713 [Chlorella ohadii]|uniref:Phosphofructokinase domain-containing protein n=1 Tax=Chlorella ohadii TaxID=2649997 RepID=A0AAD5DYA3_9CHLO|nr:hypothetical protein COHA_003713 [Chlorella ohadii]
MAGAEGERPASPAQEGKKGEAASPQQAKPAAPEAKKEGITRIPSIPVATRPTDDLEFLEIRDLRSQLKPQDSPFMATNNAGAGFVGDSDLVRISIMNYESGDSSGSHRDFAAKNSAALYDPAKNQAIPLPDFALRSGPRKTIYHNPKDVVAAIVTCGGLCPGLNDVVQNIVFSLCDYGVPEDQIFGIRYGLRGFLDRHAKPVQLSRAAVDGIQLKGGTVLGTSRGNAKMPAIVERLRLWGINQLYVIGGNGGNAAAHAISKECAAQGVVCNVVGVPKSIDNDIQLIDRCFGFDTSVEEAQRSLISARVEARSSGGISIVKLMGRQSGFIAMNASMASGVVDVCLIPEIPFDLDKLCDFVKSIMDRKDHCVVCVAEGAGQDIMDSSGPKGTDASGNPILQDIGVFLRDVFRQRFKGVDIKYIDPSYMIRSIPTITTDRIYCKVLGQGAVHGAFAGYTDFTVGLVNTHYVFLPTTTIIQFARTVDPKGRQWNRLKTAINQPDLM